MRRRQVATALLLVSAHGVLIACGGSPPGRNPPNGSPPPALPSISRFAAASDSVFVGERTRLTAEFSGESAEIDGLGPVASGGMAPKVIRRLRDQERCAPIGD